MIHVIDGCSLQLFKPIEIGPGPRGLVVDESTNTVYVTIDRAVKTDPSPWSIEAAQGTSR
jgi:hypothetical protein